MTIAKPQARYTRRLDQRSCPMRPVKSKSNFQIDSAADSNSGVEACAEVGALLIYVLPP